MKFLLLVYLDENWESKPLAERQQVYEGQMEAGKALGSKYLGGSPLHPTTTATTVRVRGGKQLLTDGPFAETREYLGGYMLIDVENLDEAIAFAARGPLASAGSIEVRPVREGPPT